MGCYVVKHLGDWETYHIVLEGEPAPEGFTADMNYCLLMEETGTKKGDFVRDSASISTAIRSEHRPSI